MRKKVMDWLCKKRWLVIILALVVVLRVPTLFEPYWYGDEAIYLTIGQAMDRGVALYSGIHDNKPPLLYVVTAVAGGSQFWFKFIAMVWNLVTICVFMNLAEKIFEKRKKPMVVATLMFAILTTIPLWEGNIANAELFFILPTILAINLLWRKNASLARVAVAGLAIGVGGLFKMPAVLEAGIWPLVWLATEEKEAKKKIVVLGAMVLLPIILSGVYFAFQGSLKDYISAAWVQNLPYLSSWQVSSAGSGVFSTKGRSVVAIVLLAGLWGMARRLGRTAAIVGIWGVITLFAVLLSGRPYPHYLIQMAGVTAVAIALMWERRKAEKFIGAGVVVMILLAWVTFRFYVYPIAGYYGNFVQWVWGGKTTEEYFAWFSPQVNVNYEVASLIKAGSSSGERMFVWGDEPVVYALAQRLPVGKYIVKYHIQDLHAEKTTMDQLMVTAPKYVVSYGNEDELPGFSEWLQNYYVLEKTIGPAKVYRRLILSAMLGRL